MTFAAVLAWAAGLVALFLGARWLVPAWRRYRGERVVTCPETHEPAAVRVDAGHAAATGLTGHAELRLSECSRWPEKKACGQDCLREVERDPGACLVRNLVEAWYDEKNCSICGKPIGNVVWTEHRPALRGPDGHTVEWQEVAPETLPEVFRTHTPVCWDCHVVEAVIHRHPGLATMRPKRPQLYS